MKEIRKSVDRMLKISDKNGIEIGNLSLSPKRNVYDVNFFLETYSQMLGFELRGELTETETTITRFGDWPEPDTTEAEPVPAPVPVPESTDEILF